jgi:hypothetical protein
MHSINSLYFLINKNIIKAFVVNIHVCIIGMRVNVKHTHMLQLHIHTHKIAVRTIFEVKVRKK